MNFGLFYGTFYVEVGNISGPKLGGKNTTAWFFTWRKKEKILFGKWVFFGARILGNKSTQKPAWKIKMQTHWFPKKTLMRIWELPSHSSFKVDRPDIRYPSHRDYSLKVHPDQEEEEAVQLSPTWHMLCFRCYWWSSSVHCLLQLFRRRPLSFWRDCGLVLDPTPNVTSLVDAIFMQIGIGSLSDHSVYHVWFELFF